jgi:hypothetical protein
MAKTRKNMMGGTSGDTEGITNELREVAGEVMDIVDKAKKVGEEVIYGASNAATVVKQGTNYVINEAAGLAGEVIDAAKDEINIVTNLPNVNSAVEKAAAIGNVLAVPFSGPNATNFYKTTGKIAGVVVSAFPTQQIEKLAGDLADVAGNTTGKVISKVVKGVASSAPGGPAVVGILEAADVAAKGIEEVTPIAKKAASVATNTYDKVTKEVRAFADNKMPTVDVSVPTVDVSNVMPKMPEVSINKNMVGGAKRKISQYRRERRRITRRLNKHIRQFNATRKRS